MLPEHRKDLARRLPDELAYPYFAGREFAWRHDGPCPINSMS